MSTENIFTEYKATFQKEPSFNIDFYNSKIIFLNNIKQFRNSEELWIYIELNWHYLNDQFKKAHFNDVVNTAEKIRPLIDNEIKRLDVEKFKDDRYYGLLYFYAVANYNLQHYKASTFTFRELVKYDTKNDRFSKWLAYSVYGQRLWFFKTLTMISIVIFLSEIFFGEKYLSPWERVWVNAIAFIGLTSSLSAEYYTQRKLKKKKSDK